MATRWLLLLLWAVLPLPAGLPSSQEALALAFPGAVLSRREHWLTEEQASKVRGLAGTPLTGLWQVAYEARRSGQLVGVAFFDTHRVRTLNGTAMVAVKANGTLLRVELVAFHEPLEYLPKEPWVRQLDGRALDPELSLRGSIRPLAGATLTAHALVDAARRGLALHQVLYGNGR